MALIRKSKYVMWPKDLWLLYKVLMKSWIVSGLTQLCSEAGGNDVPLAHALRAL